MRNYYKRVEDFSAHQDRNLETLVLIQTFISFLKAPIFSEFLISAGRAFHWEEPLTLKDFIAKVSFIYAGQLSSQSNYHCKYFQQDIQVHQYFLF